jgi:hypothetical protein
MNYKLIFKLSLFGLAMAISTVYWISSSIEPAFWLVIFIISAYLIAKNCNQKYFLHGFLTSLVNCVWITAAHCILYTPYILNHPDEAGMMAHTPMNINPRIMMLILGPLIGILSGLILGLFSFLASRLPGRKIA